MRKESGDALPMRPMRREAADLALFQACFARNGDTGRSSEGLEWQYLRNPTGLTYVDLALAPSEERLAAIYASLPGRVRIHGSVRPALQSLDTLTDADFRGRGLFVSLAKQTFARATADGAALIYGFPNGSSAHGFFQKLGWSSLDPVPFLIRPIRPRYIAARLGVGATARGFIPDPALVLGGRRRRPGVREVHAADDRMTRLWSRFAEGIGVGLERDASYLQWRLFEKPGESYRVLVLEKGDEISALCAYTVASKHGGRIGYVLELLHDVGDREAASHLLGISLRAMADDGADAVLAWCLRHSPNFWTYARHGFVPLPERVRPIELHVGVRAFDPAVASTVERRSEWYFSYLDSDTV